MRRIFLYMRQVFCPHQFRSEEALGCKIVAHGRTTTGTRVSQTCVHCGYHHSFWKWTD